MSITPPRGGTILLVEDEEDIATLVRAYLENDGFRVVWAAWNGRAKALRYGNLLS